MPAQTGMKRHPTSAMTFSGCCRAAFFPHPARIADHHTSIFETSYAVDPATSQEGCPLAPGSLLGTAEGMVSTASLVMGVAAAHARHNSALITGISGRVAGAMSMAASEYVSVPALAASEAADRVRRHAHLSRRHAWCLLWSRGHRARSECWHVIRHLDLSLCRRCYIENTSGFKKRVCI
jgi:hypothetical protein